MSWSAQTRHICAMNRLQAFTADLQSEPEVELKTESLPPAKASNLSDNSARRSSDELCQRQLTFLILAAS
jgi:hypothetical protein